MNIRHIIWASEGIHTDVGGCIDAKATPEGVVLGQLHGDGNSYAVDMRMSSADAGRLARALLTASAYAAEVGA